MEKQIVEMALNEMSLKVGTSPGMILMAIANDPEGATAKRFALYMTIAKAALCS